MSKSEKYRSEVAIAIFHLCFNVIGRSAGRSSTGAAAYRAAAEIVDERSSVVHDYRRKRGVLHSELLLPGGGTAERSKFWNSVEHHHKRGDAVVVREVEVSLPAELSKRDRQALAVGFARELADRYGTAADVSLHAPHPVTDRDLKRRPDQYFEVDSEGKRNNGNWHAHIMLAACHVSADGTLGKKIVELDAIHCQRHKISNPVERERERWAALVNSALERGGHVGMVDHRSLADQSVAAAAAGDLVAAAALDREPQLHLGPTAAAIERAGRKSRRGDEHRGRRERTLERKDLRAELAAVDAAIREEMAGSAAAGGSKAAPSVLGSYTKPKRPAAPVVPQPTPAPVQAPAGAEAEETAAVQRRSREAWKRYQAAGNSWGAGAGEVDAETEIWHGRRVGWLERRYHDDDLGRRLAEVGVVVQWISFPRAGDRCALLRMRVGTAVVTDDGRELSTDVADEQAIALMLEVAIAKGWKTITLSGSDEFVRKSLQALEGTGIEVTSINGVDVDGNGRPLPKQPRTKGPSV